MSQYQPPESILILGSGVFGLSTAWALTGRHAYLNTKITIVSPDLAESSCINAQPQIFESSRVIDSPKSTASSSTTTSPISPTLTENRTTPASIDTTRIIRADYADPFYASLACEAQKLWRTPEWGGSGPVTGSATATEDAERYHENGLLLTADAGGSGEAYLRKSFANVQKEQSLSPVTSNSHPASSNSDSGSNSTRPTLLDETQIREAMRARNAARGTGNIGYVNVQSGWADAEACMRELEARVTKGGRVNMVRGEVTRLLISPLPSSPTKSRSAAHARVSGAVLKNGSTIEADLTILATGAWTPSLLDLRGRASVTAQSMAYFDVPEACAKKLKDIPVHLNIGTGCFLFPPNRKRARQEDCENKSQSQGGKGGVDVHSKTKEAGWEIKVARHAFGYINPMDVPAPLGSSEAEAAATKTTGTGSITVSLPSPSSTPIPNSDITLLATFLRHALPVLGHVGQPSRTRLCHYLDTVNGEYIIDYHPDFPGLFVATGGSGHAFKMLPVLGEKIFDVIGCGGSKGVQGIAGVGGEASEASRSAETDSPKTSESTKAWAQKWAWPEQRQKEDQVWCDDGSRAGIKGLRLDDVRKRERGAKI